MDLLSVSGSLEIPRIVLAFCFASACTFRLEKSEQPSKNRADRTGDRNKGFEAQWQHLEIPPNMNIEVSGCLRESNHVNAL